MEKTWLELIRAFEERASSLRLRAQRLGREVEDLGKAMAALLARLLELEASYRDLQEADLGLNQVVVELSLGADELFQHNEELRRLDQKKTDFLATVSHEIRNPLTSIKGSLSLLLEKGIVSGVQRELLLIAQQNAHRLLRLVSNLLDLAKLEVGRIELELREVNLPGLICTTMETLQEVAREKSVEVHSSLPEETPLIQADEDRLSSVLLNLLDNAIKFSHQGGRIWIEASVSEDAVLVAVKDEGPGIAPEEQHKVFEKFYQAEGSPRQGVGLGLYICKAFVEEHGGRIWVESGTWGSRFCFSLPLRRVER